MKKIYLAGPMTGYPDLNFPEFERAAKYLRSQGHYVFAPNELGNDIEYNIALATDLQWICLHADAVAFLPGSEVSPGAKAEHALAVALNRELIYLRSGDYAD